MSLRLLIEPGELRPPRTVRWYSADSDAGDIDLLLDELCDGEHEVVAIEVFDHILARHSTRHGGVIGPWCVGPTDDVYEHLKERGFEDFSQQYSVGPPPQEW